jgi:hypothetical protein
MNIVYWYPKFRQEKASALVCSQLKLEGLL